MEEKQISHEESFQIIQSMINTAKNKISENGFHFLLWGVLVVIASLVEYFLQSNGRSPLSNITWIILPIIGLPTALIYEVKRVKKPKTQGYTDKWYKFLWLAFGITLIITVFISIKQHMSPIPFILALVGMATFVSGSIYQFRSLTIGGIVFWAASLIAIMVKIPEQLLINAIATFLGYIIPGIILWKNSKKNNHV